jgi:hypothetical protein
MPLFSNNGTGDLIGSSSYLNMLNRAYGNGTLRAVARPASARAYGAKNAVRMPESARIKRVAEEAFDFVAPARGREEILQIMGGTKMRGRVRNAVAGGVAAAAKQAAWDVETAEIYRSNVPTVTQVPRYVNAPAGVSPGLADYVEIPGTAEEGYYQAEDFYEAMPGVGMGQIEWTLPQQYWRRDFEDFCKDVRNFHAFTTTGVERRVFKKGMNVVVVGSREFAGNPQVLAGINAIAGELDRWKAHREAAITGIPGTSNRFSLSKIEGRMINAINFARVALQLAPLGAPSTIPTGIIPTADEEAAPGSPGLPAPKEEEETPIRTKEEQAMVERMKPSFFEKNKTVVLAGTGIVALGLAFYFLKKK